MTKVLPNLSLIPCRGSIPEEFRQIHNGGLRQTGPTTEKSSVLYIFMSSSSFTHTQSYEATTKKINLGLAGAGGFEPPNAGIKNRCLGPLGYAPAG